MPEEPKESVLEGGRGPEVAEDDKTVPAPGVIPGASKLPPPPPANTEAIASAVERLRAEVAATDDKTRKARLIHEVAEIEERGGDEPGAARDYLAAYNSDTNFREPLEGLVRLLERRRSLANLGKLIEALVAAASTPEERARAITQRAIFIEDVQKDLEGARGAAREATETDAVPADLGAAWLELEMTAAKLGDAALREEALLGRAKGGGDPTWTGLLLVDAAMLAAQAGETDRALEELERARDGGAASAYAASLAIERVVRADPGLPGSDESRKRARSLAQSFEIRAETINDAMTDAARGDAEGVPRRVRNVAHVVDLLLRASDHRRSANELGRAVTAIDRALTLVGAGAIERTLLTTRLRLAELQGDTARAAELAQRRMEHETDGGVVASLAMRIAENASAEGDLQSALAALTTATERDPASAPARALKIDLLEAASDAARFATELEEVSQKMGAGDAQGRALLLAAYVWAVRVGDADRARAALGQAEACGVAKDVVARLGRSLASVRGDDAWYEAATKNLVPHATPAERPLLWIEIARLRLAQRDDAGVAAAIASLRELPEGAWLGRVLDGLASPDAEPERTRTALEELARDVDDPVLQRTLLVVCAVRAHAAGDDAAAIAHLRSLAEKDPSDVLVSAYLGDMLRAAGDRAAAAGVASAVAEASFADPELAAARHLEAAIETWKAGDRRAALTSIEAARKAAQHAADPLLTWALRGVDIDSLDGRRAALEVAGGDASVTLERFALEATQGDHDQASTALTSLEVASSASLRLAGALARVTWPGGAADPEAVQGALETLTVAGEDGRGAAAAERVRIARESGGDVAIAAQEWLDSGGGAAAALEWLASTMGTGDVLGEVPARRALAERLTDEAREAMHASATMLAWVMRPEENHPLVAGSSHSTRLANLELAPPGCDPRRRASVLSEVDGALGDEGEIDALALAGWSALAAGDAAAAYEMFRTVTTARADDIAAWEGMRSAAEKKDDMEGYALACEQLGARTTNPSRGSAFWEQAAYAWTKAGEGREARAEAALDASFTRDPHRVTSFDRLFRRVRERKEGDRLLDLITRRLEVTDDPAEIAKLYWEQARVLREKGDPDGALEALEHVTMFDDNHVGALALTGEIFIRRGMFAEAAEKLSRLARVEAAPAKNRVTAGVAAVDLYENKLQQHDKALEVLLALHAARLTTLPVRERLARAAARTGSWNEATRILEELMMERPEREGRIEAARLAMAIHRDRSMSPIGGLRAAQKLLEESPIDGEALDLVAALDPQIPERRPLLERGRDALLMALHDLPQNLEQQRRLARIAHALQDGMLEQAALSCAIALGGPDGSSEQAIALISGRKPRAPQVALTPHMIESVVAPGDDGPLTDLFAALGPTLGEALGPTREGLGVTKKDRIDPRAGLALRNEIAQWAGAFGIATFDLYVGGKDPGGVQGIAGETPAIVVGAGVNAPLSPMTRARVARELVSIARGTTVLRWRDDTTIAAIVVAACRLTDVKVDAPPFAVLAEVERLLKKAISRKTKAQIEPICRAYVQTGRDARQWAARARATQARFAAVASGDAAAVLTDVFGEPIERLGAVARDDLRAQELLRFVLSRPYFELRRSLGLEG